MNELISQLTMAPLGASVVALAAAAFFYFRVRGLPEGTETMNLIARYIREGSMAFLVREYKVLAVYTVAVFSLLFIAFNSQDGVALATDAGTGNAIQRDCFARCASSSSFSDAAGWSVS